MIRPAAAVGLLWVAVATTALSQTGDDFANWPSGWIEAYKRFEAYIESRRANWPESGLHFAEDGGIDYSVRSVETSTEHLTLDVYRRGTVILGKGVRGGGGVKETLADASKFTPGVYAGFIKSAGALGYQTHLPIVWFEVLDVASRGATKCDQPSLRLREIPAPSPDETVWPNGRMQLFLDYHIFPHHTHPNEIHKANAKVQPAIDLRVTDSGVVKRDKLFEAAVEQLLRWRIYHDGQLVEKDSAAGARDHPTDHGTGSYSVCIGVDGPSGFMPVSNLLEFPLFPSSTGGKTIKPKRNGPNGLPDFAERQLEEQLQTRNGRGSDSDSAETPTGYALSTPDPVQTTPQPSESQKKDQELTELWSAWAFRLDHPDIFTITFAK